ncbi:MAG: amidohydrolase family protein [Clostridia bacterium]|nr:amidohydrolase family protein [Clostridia bacterium]
MIDFKAIKKIDIHVHASLFSDITPVPYFSADDILKIYDENNVEAGVLMSSVDASGLSTVSPSEQSKMLSDNSNGRLKWFCNVSPFALENSPNADLSKLLNHYKSLGAKGVGEVSANIYADDPFMDNLFYHCAKSDMPVIIHLATKTGGTYGIVDDKGLPRIEKMLKKHKGLKLIGHSQVFWSEISSDCKEEERSKYPTGNVKEGRIAKLMRECDNLYCDLSAGSGANAMMRDRKYAADFLTEFADRIFYGTDLCRKGQKFREDFSSFLENLVSDGLLSIENYVKIVRNNAAKLLGIEEYKL